LNVSLSTIFSAIEANDETEQHPPGKAITGKAGNILLVEDNSKDVELTLAAFEEAKLANPLHVVRDGAQALDYLFCRGAYLKRRMADQPQVVLLDLNLPKIHGLEVLRRLKEDQRTQKIHVVVLTVSRKDEHIHTALKLGAAAYLVKPVEFENFAQIVPQLNFHWALIGKD
jgi:two-component system response regulator